MICLNHYLYDNAPLCHADVPPTLLAFGEHDFLAFGDIAYACHAVKAGVRNKTIVYRGLSHGFADQSGVLQVIAECACFPKLKT